jgi:hypothetical protein
MKRRALLSILLTALIAVVSVIPALAAPATFADVGGTYTITCKLPVRYMDGTVATRATTGSLTITDDTSATRGTIGTATITVTGYGTVALVGFVGAGLNPRLSLVGSDGVTVVTLNAKVHTHTYVVQKISGRLDGWCWHTGGELGDEPVGAVASWSVADSYNGSVSALLTQAAAAGSTYVQVTPPTGITLGQMSAITADKWGLWFNLQDSTNGGPQVELRFIAPTNVNPDGAGHVDVTLLTPTVGTGAWVNRTYTGAFPCMYYGNDPFDGTAFDGPVDTLANAETSINAEAAMLANGGFVASNWVLSRVRVEVWDAGARTCYVDDLMVNGRTYSFEPAQYAGTFTAIP